MMDIGLLSDGNHNAKVIMETKAIMNATIVLLKYPIDLNDVFEIIISVSLI